MSSPTEGEVGGGGADKDKNKTIEMKFNEPIRSEEKRRRSADSVDHDLVALRGVEGWRLHRLFEVSQDEKSNVAAAFPVACNLCGCECECLCTCTEKGRERESK